MIRTRKVCCGQIHSYQSLMLTIGAGSVLRILSWCAQLWLMPASMAARFSVLARNARGCGGHATTASTILGTQEPTVPFMNCPLSAAWKCQAPPTERADVLLPPDEQRGDQGPMVLRPSAHNEPPPSCAQ